MKGKLRKKTEGGGGELLWRERDGKEREKVVDACVFCFFLFSFELPAGEKKKISKGGREKEEKREKEREKGEIR